MPPPTRLSWSAYLVYGWCVAFSALHVYWGAGGTTGLASSAGADLAARRPPLFVVLGLWGTALLLLMGAALGATLARGRPRGRLRQGAVGAAVLVGVALVVRGVVLELVLVTGAGGIATSVGASETHWSLVLWNPWFVLGGAAFLILARNSHRRPPGTRCPRRRT